MSDQWYYVVGGQQAGPVSWEALRQLAEQQKLGDGDLVWNATMTGWTPASKVDGLLTPTLPPLPPPLPPAIPAMALVAQPGRVTGEVVLAGFGGGNLPGMMNKIEVKLAGKNLGSGTVQGGFRASFEA